MNVHRSENEREASGLGERVMIKYLKSKLFGIRVTSCEAEYSGSIAIGWEILEAAGLHPYESVLINHQSNGRSWETYVIPGEPGECSLRGGAVAGLEAEFGDRLVILSWRWESEHATPAKPAVIRFDHVNRIDNEKSIPNNLVKPLPQSLTTPIDLPQSLEDIT